MASPTEGIWKKIDRAKRHTDELERQIIAYWKSEPYEIGTEGNPQTGPGSYCVKSVKKQLPLEIALIIGDVVHNLRSAFDYLAYAAVPQPHGGRYVAFPIWRAGTPDSAKWNGIVKGKLAGAKAGFCQAVCKMEPYPGGNSEWLWTIDNLNVIDKHRLLLATAGTHTSIDLDMGAMMRGEFPYTVDTAPSMIITYWAKEWVPIEPGVKLLEILDPNGLKYDGEFKFAFDITLIEPATLKAQPIVPTLRELTDHSERLLQTLIPLADI